MSSHNSSSRSIVCIVAAFLSITTFWEPCRAFAFQTSCMMVKRHTRIQSSANANEIEIDIDDYNDNCNNNNNSNDFEHVAAAVVVPGFLTGSDEFEPLCKSLTKMGIPTVAVPMPNWHWLPCLGGRSARPILERIDFTVKHLVANLETETETIKTKDDHPILDNNTQAQTQTHTAILNIPKYHYSLWDCWKDFRETPGGVFKVGGASRVQEYPVVEPRGYFPQPENLRAKDVPKKKIALIGHRYVPPPKKIDESRIRFVYYSQPSTANSITNVITNELSHTTFFVLFFVSLISCVSTCSVPADGSAASISVRAITVAKPMGEPITFTAWSPSEHPTPPREDPPLTEYDGLMMMIMIIIIMMIPPEKKTDSPKSDP